MTDETGMNCHNCGGPLRATHSPNKLACDYCGGIQLLDPDDADDAGLRLLTACALSCPLCNTTLRNALLDGLPAEACCTCGGVLISNDTFAQVVRARRIRFEGVREERRPVDAAELRRRVSCPRCGREMETHPYYGSGGVVLDTCARCTLVWLDRNELSVIERAEGRVV